MEVLFLFDNTSRTASCSLFSVDLDSTISDLRSRVQKEVQDLVPREFLFVRGLEDRISKTDEKKLAVKSVASRENGNLSIRFADVSSREDEKNAITVTDKVSEQEQCEVHRQDASGKETTPLTLALESPTSWSIRGVKVFTQKEIENAIGKEKERRQFWNKRAKDLSKTPLTKAKIYGTIHSEWQIKKSENLLGDAVGLSALKDSPGVKKGTLERNIVRVETFKTEFNKLSNEVKDLEKKVGKNTKEKEMLKELREKLTLSKSNLRKAQDAMRKNLKKCSG